ncbi:aminopeptidase N [Demequina sp. TTPB684]|uniref:aminopeptidase N n=1 Tax=unclassified Demequina TaxID=2620311 RepID=UPI001CF3705B|nr:MULTISPECIES: aminopeptidase N [unclassified Demequina]MCB2411942.1 aminopeptidase N [Demequina sp. TTPB684]UPU87143.1 aminopeptidase N [Demequina sp. TMPB413]
MPGTNLTKSEATDRAALIPSAAYDITWDFTGPGDTFRTATTIAFEAPAGASTFLDCMGATVGSISLNGTVLDPATAVNDGRVELTHLAEHNSVTIEADFAYRTDGQGIHRFVDPEDGEVYLYSQFAAADARAAFPCFDQPDVKGTFAIEVFAPAHWVVVSNSPTPEPALAEGATTSIGEGAVNRWSFAPTVALPTYVAAVVAGPYAWAEGELRSRKGTLKARVYGRKNLAAHLDAEEMIGTVQAGMTLYERVFDTEYPYDKYDQVFVPEYNLGAMENVGCVTFSEDSLLFRSRASDAERERRLNIVLHELSHMWFGNLVTMRWWDDLWLNESFAEFVGTWATEQVTPWKDAWVTFGASRKSIAYVQDQLPTTHAIVTEVPDIEATVSAFDMITYAKGASALKQLAAHVGEDAFFAGVAAYLKRYAFGNATLAEFLAEVEAAAGRPLDAWAEVWLKTPGVTTLRPVVDTDDAGVITSLRVAEDVPAAHPVQRPHRVTIAGYQHEDGHFERTWSLVATLDGPLSDVTEAVGKPRPDLLLVNDADRTYAKAQLDDASLATIAAHVGDLTHPMAQASVLDALWHMCRDAVLPAQHYIDAVLTVLPAMANSEAAEAHARTMVVALTRYVPPAQVPAVAAASAESLWTTVTGAAPGSDLQLQALKAYARVASTPAQAARLGALLDGSDALQGLEIDTDLSWDLLAGMAACGMAGEREIAARLESDPGAIGRRRAAGTMAVIATSEAKRAAWDALAHPADGPAPNAVQYEIALGLVRATDPVQLTFLVPTLLEELREYYDANEGWVGARVARYVFPTWAAGRVDGLESLIEDWLATNADAPSVLRKIVTEGLDEVRRSTKAQEASAAQAGL